MLPAVRKVLADVLPGVGLPSTVILLARHRRKRASRGRFSMEWVINWPVVAAYGVLVFLSATIANLICRSRRRPPAGCGAAGRSDFHGAAYRLDQYSARFSWASRLSATVISTANHPASQEGPKDLSWRQAWRGRCPLLHLAAPVSHGRTASECRRWRPGRDLATLDPRQ